MDCPCCGVLRYSKQWSKSQWTALSPYVDGLFGCRQCRAGTSEVDPDDVNYRDRRSQLTVELATYLDGCRRMIAAYPSATSRWDAFMCTWESGAPKATRKKLSHNGALPRTFPWEPSHWADPPSTARVAPYGDAESAPSTPRMFYDAGNNVYAFAIQWLFPEAESTSRYSSEYLGDVVEAILGLDWLSQKQTSLAWLLALTSKYLFGLSCLCKIESFDYHENRKILEQIVSGHSRISNDQLQAHGLTFSFLTAMCDGLFNEMDGIVSGSLDAALSKERDPTRCDKHADSQEPGPNVHRIPSTSHSDAPWRVKNLRGAPVVTNLRNPADAGSHKVVCEKQTQTGSSANDSPMREIISRAKHSEIQERESQESGAEVHVNRFTRHPVIVSDSLDAAVLKERDPTGCDKHADSQEPGPNVHRNSSTSHSDAPWRVKNLRRAPVATKLRNPADAGSHKVVREKQAQPRSPASDSPRREIITSAKHSEVQERESQESGAKVHVNRFTRHSDPPSRRKKQHRAAVAPKVNNPGDVRQNGMVRAKQAQNRHTESEGPKRKASSLDRHTDAHERGKRPRRMGCVGVTDSNEGEDEKKYFLTGLPAIVRLFAVSWFPRALSSSLLGSIMEVRPRGNRETLRLVNSFSQAFFRTSYGVRGTEWSTELTSALLQLRKIRSTHADEYSRLSEKETSEVLWEYARDFLLDTHQHTLKTRKLRSIVSYIIHKHIGCRKRLRAVAKIGLARFASADTNDDLVEAFISYIHEIEKTAACLEE